MKRKARIAAILALLLAGDRPGLIAITEIMRAWWAALLAVWKILGVTYKGWQTRNDAKVCPACRKNQDAGLHPSRCPVPQRRRAPRSPHSLPVQADQAAPRLGASGHGV